MFSHKMLDEVVLAETGVRAVAKITCPEFKLTMSLILVSDPIGLALERLRFVAPDEGAGKWLDVLMNMFSPVRRLVEPLDFETQVAFEFRRKALDRWSRDARRELRSHRLVLA